MTKAQEAEAWRLFKAQAGEAIHTAFRKGCEGGGEVHQAISRLAGEQYGAAIDWIIEAIEWQVSS